MTLPDNAAARKPRRLGLIIPWALAAVIAVAWSGGWFWLKGETERKMDSARAQAAKAGWRLDWTSRKVSGFPFRLDVDLTNARWGEASGWSVTAPVLNAQAYLSRTDSWMMVAPEGLVLNRPNDLQIHMNAKILRASLSEIDQYPPRLSVEGMGLAFKDAESAKLAWWSAASEFHLHTRAGPNDKGAFYLEIDRAVGTHGTRALSQHDRIFDVTYSHARALRGRSISDALRGWRNAGGRFQMKQMSLESELFFSILANLVGGDDHSVTEITYTAQTRSQRVSSPPH